MTLTQLQRIALRALSRPSAEGYTRTGGGAVVQWSVPGGTEHLRVHAATLDALVGRGFVEPQPWGPSTRYRLTDAGRKEAARISPSPRAK